MQKSPSSQTPVSSQVLPSSGVQRPSTQISPSPHSELRVQVPGFGTGVGSSGATQKPSAEHSVPSGHMESLSQPAMVQPRSVQSSPSMHSKSPRQGSRSGGSTSRHPRPSQ